MSSTPAASKSSQDWNTVPSPKTRGKRSADPCVDTKILALKDSLSAQKAAFETQTINIKNLFDDQELKRKSDTDRLLEAIMSISTAMPESTRSSSNFVFPPVFPSYGGISSPVPVPNINIIDLALATANAACNQLPGHSKNNNDHLHPYMATGKPAATDFLIDDNVQDLDSTVSIDKHDEVSPASVFPRFSTPYGGIRSPVPALLAARTPPGSTSWTENPHEYLGKLAHELLPDKLADLESTKSTIVPDSINTNSLTIEFSLIPEHSTQELLLQRNSTMLESSVATKEYIYFYKIFALVGQFIIQGQSTPMNVLPFSIQTFIQWKLYPIG
jgi:hypothetical protein